MMYPQPSIEARDVGLLILCACKWITLLLPHLLLIRSHTSVTRGFSLSCSRVQRRAALRCERRQWREALHVCVSSSDAESHVT